MNSGTIDQYAITKDMLRQQLRMLAKHYTPASLETVLATIDDHRKSSQFVAAVCDDGLLNQTEIAARTFAEEGWPWALAICPGLVGTSRSVWSYELAFIVTKWWPAGALPGPPGMGMSLNLSDEKNRLATLKGLKDFLFHRCEDLQRLEYLDLLINTGGRENFEQSLAKDGRFALAGWERIKELFKAGTTILSHGFMHRPQNQTISLRLLQEEVTWSRTVIQDRIGQAPDVFVLPHGFKHPESEATIRKAGYKYCLTTRPGRIASKTNPFDLPRYDAAYPCDVLRHTLVAIS